jgi:hypothetical protein
MRICTLLAALLALGNWTMVASGQALAHGGTDFAVLDCEDEDCEDSARVFDCEDEECEGDEAILDCEDEDGDDSAAVLECHDDEEDQE